MSQKRNHLKVCINQNLITQAKLEGFGQVLQKLAWIF